MAARKLSPDEEFHYGWHGVPDPQKRATLSSEDLAIELSKIEDKNSPPYILLGHELNIRLAQEQAKLNHRSARLNAVFTIIGAVVGSAATAMFSSQPTQPIAHYQTPQNCPTACATSKSVVINKNNLATPLPAVGVKTPAPSKSNQHNDDNNQQP